ncbi:DEKNAAC103493 [Brettanomyces naardenensis]|uniref:mRNA-capping enzyme subunit alpha n=1 Tax=Brettanomyces naardenensis TaxID=13370 RepID=A0A448YMZ5_BRENA|nr:DEKNAAC103493 [Brettanomyces naardenensis]
MITPSDRTVPEMPGEPVSDEVANYLKTKVSQMLHTRFNQFPGSQPVSFTRDHLHHNLMETDYLVCEKSDGLRVLMLVLTNQDTGEEGTFLINRENEYFMVPGFHFPRTNKNFDTSHNGTILDGELVYSTNPNTGVREVRYLIFDCLAMDMASVMHKNLWKRLYHAQHEFHKPYMELRRAYPEACSHFPFKLDFKNMTQPFKIDKIFREMKNLTYVSDGLVLTCCDSPYSPGTDQTLLKWKPAEENTIDFKIAVEFPKYVDSELPKHDPNREYPNYDAKPEFKLCVWKGGNDPYEGEGIEENTKRNGGEYRNSFRLYDDWHVPLSVSEDEWLAMKETGESFNGRIAECRRTRDGQWKMLRWRDDKLNGNHINVVLRILKSIEDSVTKQELIDAESEMKKRWTEREERKKAKALVQPPQPKTHQSNVPSVSSHHDEELPHYEEDTESRSQSEANGKETHENEKRKGEEHQQNEHEKADSDEYYESDGFEEEPKYAQANEPDTKRQKV